MKERGDELYQQLNFCSENSKTVLFVTFTLQHLKKDKLSDLLAKLQDAFNYANNHRKWKDLKKKLSIEYLRTLEVLSGKNGWHPHYHCIFIGDSEIENSINIFVDLYKSRLKKKYKLLVNEHTVVVDKWNGKLEMLQEYMFKDNIEKEMFGGQTKTGRGSNFFELIEANKTVECAEYIEEMKGKRQFHHSKKFFKNVAVKTDADILSDDKIDEIIFQIPIAIYKEMKEKHSQLVLHFINEYKYGGFQKAEDLLTLYDIDFAFMHSEVKLFG